VWCSTSTASIRCEFDNSTVSGVEVKMVRAVSLLFP
jgi:hypothetical protein